MANKNAVEQLNNVANKEKSPIKKVRTVFPFTLFPDSIHIYRNKVVIIRRYFPFAKKEFPILLSDIKTVTVTTNVFFASVFFEIKAFETNPDAIPYLLRNDGIDVRRIVTGLTIINNKEIQNEDVPREELLEQARKLG